MEINVEKLSDFKFEIKKDAGRGMKTGVVVYASETLIEKIKKDRTLEQAANAATLPGLVGNVLVMPDGHEGYGFPIGGVAASDAEEGIISPGAVGFDINCGMKLVKTNLTEKDIRPKLGQLADALFKNVPSGVGSKLNLDINGNDLEKICEEGMQYMVSKGFGNSEDVEVTEENGFMKDADFSKVSEEAKRRGLHELGTLGAGNHFLEVQKVEKILDEKTARAYGLEQGQIVVMVHCGSRGFGHQICSDYLRILNEYQRNKGIVLADRELSYAHIKDKEAQDYLDAMKCAVNYAFTNRQLIIHAIRESFSGVFGKRPESMGMDVLYDVAHNIAKLEEHEVEGKKVKVFVHRKGATRAFPKGRNEVPKKYRGTGQPVLIPGSMGTSSYVLCGAEGSLKETFGSSCHGAGRVMSRHEAVREIPESKTFDSLESKNILIRIKSRKLVSEEAEWAYKDIDEVVKTVENAGISRIVSKNLPVCVIKG